MTETKEPETKQLEYILSKHKLYPGFSEWLQANSTRVLRETTLYNYLRHLHNLTVNYGLDLENPDPPTVVANLRDNVSAATLTLRTFILRKWLKHRGIELGDMEQMLKAKQGERRNKLRPCDLLTFDEILDIIGHTRSPALRAYWAVLYDTGCRPSEMCKTNIADVQQDRHGYVFTFRHTKNVQSKRSVRLLDPRSIQFFDQWWSMHPKRNDPSAPVFFGAMGNRLRARALTDLLKKQHEKRLGRGNGEKAPLNLYLFRKSRITQLLKEKLLTEIEIKVRAGHKKHSMMLEQYYAILDAEDQNFAELRYLGAAEEKDVAKAPITCTNCGAPNDASSPSCLRCKHPLSAEELMRQQKMAASGAIFEDVLGNAFGDAFSDYMVSHGEHISELLQPIVNRMLVEERKKQSGT